MLTIQEYTLGLFQVHNYLVWDSDTREAVLIDTGDDPSEILADIDSLNLNLRYLLYTHAHIDHIQGHAMIREAHPTVPVWIHTEERFWIDALQLQAAKYGLPLPAEPHIDGYVEHGQRFELTNMSFEARFCPGHTPGGISYFVPEIPAVFTGDSLFAGTIGRTDFPRGDFDTLIHSIKSQLLTLPPETSVHSGHGPVTTIGREAERNPYLTATH